MDGRPNRRNKAAYLNSFGVLWTRPQSTSPHSLLFSWQEAEVVTSMSFHPTGEFILVGTEHPTSELPCDNF